MLNVCQSIAARDELCWKERLAPFWLMAAWPPTTRPPVGKAALETCAAELNAGAPNAKATAVNKICFLGTDPPRVTTLCQPAPKCGCSSLRSPLPHGVLVYEDTSADDAKHASVRELQRIAGS